MALRFLSENPLSEGFLRNRPQPKIAFQEGATGVVRLIIGTTMLLNARAIETEQWRAVKVKGSTNEIRSVLAALASPEECASLRRILCGGDWALRFAPAFRDVEAELRAASFDVVICAGYFGDGHCWKDVLDEIQRMPIPPQLIVADRLAHDGLWAEVLNLGCYDLLMTPFNAAEVLRVMPLAWDFWKRELGRVAARPKPSKLAEPGWRSSRKALAADAD